MLAVAILIIGILSRLVLHSANFTPVFALALFGGMYLKKKHALYVPLALMVVSDFIIGLHSIFFFTWGSILLISGLGLMARKNKNLKTVFGYSILSSVLFFVITNFGAWLVMYPKTLNGLVQCYTLAIPFFRNTLASTVLYSVGLFWFYEVIAAKVRCTRFAGILN